MESDQILNGLFRLFSGTSVHNPFEVIIIIFSLCISLSLLPGSLSQASYSLNKYDFASVEKTAKLNFNSNQNPIEYFHFAFIMLLRCLAFVCVFLQFKRLEKVQSKAILVMSIIATLVSSILFNNALMNWFNFEIPNNLFLIIDIVIYTLVIIDLKKCNLILNNALEMNNIKEAKRNIIQNIAQFASKSSLDTFFLILLVALGNLSDSREIKNFSSFSCILLTSNFLLFITIYPALLSLILQFKKNSNIFENKANISELKRLNSEKRLLENGKHNEDISYHQKTSKNKLELKDNPVLVYVKILMTSFLFLIHLKLLLFNEKQLNLEVLKDKLNNSNKAQTDFDQNRGTNEIIFYTECCLLVTLIIYVLTKLFKHENSTLVKTSTHNYEKRTQSVSTQTDIQQAEKTQTISQPILSQIIEPNVLPLPLPLLQEQQDNVSQTKPTQIKMSQRVIEQCLEVFREKQKLDDLLDEEVVELVANKHIPLYKLETYFSDPIRAVSIRRKQIESKLRTKASLDDIPFENYNYSKVIGSCCENVIGYMPLPLGIAGPLLIDGKFYHIPMATTEGTLIASTNRGCTALSSGHGVYTKVLSDGMTRGPVLKFQSAMRAAQVKEWLEDEENFARIKRIFDSTSRFAKLETIKCCVVGRYLYMRFASKTGDAMGMNMLSKGSEKALIELKKEFPDANIMSVSGNFCVDKKPSAMNWIEGRGKSVTCEAIIKAETVKSVLKTSVQALIDLNLSKNFVGSAMSGSIGGFNAHAANIVTAMFIACGQDPAQVVESCNCLTWMEFVGPDCEDLYISCTMPCLEVGTVGGGTILDAQSACLKMLGVYGPHLDNPGENASTLATVIASAVLAGELSLMSALASGHLVNSHMKYNRSTIFNSKDTGASNINHNLL